MPFIDQMLDRIVGKDWYYFLNGYFGYNQISIAPKDQERMTFNVLIEHLLLREYYLVYVVT